MAVIVRLRRMGNTNNSFYRVVVADSRSPSKGRFIETLGWYDPNIDGVNFKLDLERLDYWKGNGAQLSKTIASIVRKARRLANRTVAASPADDAAIEAVAAADVATDVAEAPAEVTAAPEVAAEEKQPVATEA